MEDTGSQVVMSLTTRLGDELGRLNQIKELQWIQQQVQLADDRTIVNTGKGSRPHSYIITLMYMQKYTSVNVDLEIPSQGQRHLHL